MPPVLRSFARSLPPPLNQTVNRVYRENTCLSWPIRMALCCTFLGATASAEDPAVTEKASQYLQKVTTPESPGAAILVARDGKILYQGRAGNADLSTKAPITADTKFRIGSISKQFTAAAILKLAEQKKLVVTDPLNKFFPDYPHSEGITLHHLLSHTSGLHSYTEKPDFYNRVTQPAEPQAIIDWFKDDPVDFAPGAGFHYCNSGYFLLGEIVAKVSGKSCADFLRDEFFIPLEMKDTGIYVNSAPPENMARGYSFVEGKYEPALDWDMSWAGGAGALYSTVGDLYRWNEALFGGRVLNEASFRAATTPVKLPENVDGMIYGYGLGIFEVGRLPAIGHGGGLNGWSTDLLRVTEQKLTVVVLTNVQPGPPELAPQTISRLFAEKLLADEIKKLPPMEEDRTIDPKTFAEFVGRYDYQGAIMTVTAENEGLFAQLTSQPKLQIYPKAKDEFFWKVVDAQVKFFRNEQGEIHAAKHTQSGNSFTAPKLAADPVQLTPELLEKITGSYQYGPATMVVSRDETQLFAQLTGQPKFPIFPKSETVFEWRVVEAKVEFIQDDEGNVTAARHTQNGLTFDAPRVK
jgi:CubicO group peptidase (beta-lactamase class C family)